MNRSASSTASVLDPSAQMRSAQAKPPVTPDRSLEFVSQFLKVQNRPHLFSLAVALATSAPDAQLQMHEDLLGSITHMYRYMYMYTHMYIEMCMYM